MMACIIKIKHRKAPAVDDPDGDGRAVDLLLGELDVEELDGGGEVGVLLGVGDDRGLDDVAGALDVHPRLVHRHPGHALQVAQAPEKHLEPVSKLHFS